MTEQADVKLEMNPRRVTAELTLSTILFNIEASYSDSRYVVLDVGSIFCIRSHLREQFAQVTGAE